MALGVCVGYFLVDYSVNTLTRRVVHAARSVSLSVLFFFFFTCASPGSFSCIVSPLFFFSALPNYLRLSGGVGPFYSDFPWSASAGPLAPRSVQHVGQETSRASLSCCCFDTQRSAPQTALCLCLCLRPQPAGWGCCRSVCAPASH